ncbi:MAG: FAD-binding oxidoreductase [Betaproteobacteria bacterium]|nr:FAD-binding oxidoreductase [Betaproteobacteria bacterium]
MIDSSFIERVRQIVGAAGVLTDAGDIDPYVRDWRGNYIGKTAVVVRPANTEEVAAVVKLCAQTHTPIVPQGGNTGMVGGGVPDTSGDAIVLSLKRMTRIREIDLANNAMTVDAGCILQTIQNAALENDRYFPLSLAAEGSCTIGGNLSTNAGGTAVLRFGNARDLVLGIEAVTPDGRIWNGLKALRKDNTGYDLKHLLMGAEGTLGIITGAVLKLYPKPQRTCTALVAVPSPRASVQLLATIRGAMGDRLTGFELMSRVCVDHVITHFPSTAEPFEQRHDWQVLVELTDTLKDAQLEDALATSLEPAFESGLAEDAVIASSESQASALWGIREHIPEAEKARGKSVKHDISVPISRIAEFIERGDAALNAAFPNAQVICFGHIGDGNLHYNLSFPGATPSVEQTHAANSIVYALLDELGGSISAEHGLGQMKRDEITRHKGEVELDMMRAIKRALDPHGIMNPGKVL